MKNKKLWKPSRFTIKNDALTVNKDLMKSGIGSILANAMTADFYSRSINKYAKGELLDLGCGNVPLYGFYKHYIKNNICVDWKSPENEANHLDIEMDINNPLPFADETFDTIICSDVLEHLYEPKKALKEMVRICRSGGVILLNTPFTYWMHAHPYDYHRYTRFFYERFGEECQEIETVEVCAFGSAKEVLADIFAKSIRTCFPRISIMIQKSAVAKWKKKNKPQGREWTIGFGVVYRKK